MYLGQCKVYLPYHIEAILLCIIFYTLLVRLIPTRECLKDFSYHRVYVYSNCSRRVNTHFNKCLQL